MLLQQNQWTRGASIAHAQPSPFESLTDAMQGQMKASDGVGLSTIVDMLAENAERVARGFEPTPPGFPPGPQGECGLRLAENPLAFLKSTRDEFGPLATVVLGGERVILVGDPAVARNIVEEQPQMWAKEGTAFFPGSALAGNGLLVSDGEIWKRQRRLSNPAFRSAAVRLSHMRSPQTQALPATAEHCRALPNASTGTLHNPDSTSLRCLRLQKRCAGATVLTRHDGLHT
jgi:hypothetical protein